MNSLFDFLLPILLVASVLTFIICFVFYWYITQGKAFTFLDARQEITLIPDFQPEQRIAIADYIFHKYGVRPDSQWLDDLAYTLYAFGPVGGVDNHAWPEVQKLKQWLYDYKRTEELFDLDDLLYIENVITPNQPSKINKDLLIAPNSEAADV
jgi:hypothetical protein